MSAETFWQMQHETITQHGIEGVIRMDETMPTTLFLQNMALKISEVHPKQSVVLDALAGFCNRLEVAKIGKTHVYLFGTDAENLSIFIRQEPDAFPGSRQPRDMIADIQHNSVGPNTLFFSYDTRTNLPMLLARANDETAYQNTVWPHLPAADYQLRNLEPAQKIFIGQLLLETIIPTEHIQAESNQIPMTALPNSFLLFLDTMEIIDIQKTPSRIAPMATVVASTVADISPTPTLFVLRQDTAQLMQKYIWRVENRIYMGDVDSTACTLLLPEDSITFIGKISTVISPATL